MNFPLIKEIILNYFPGIGKLWAVLYRNFCGHDQEPRDMTPYLDFLSEHQAEVYGIVPLVEVDGSRREDAFLFTLMLGETPYIIWENVNDARATFAFPCTQENYDERLQLVFDFAAGANENKRRFLHSEASAEVFSQKPVTLVHNNLESWSTRLLALCM